MKPIITLYHHPSVFTKNFGVTAVMKTSVLLTWEVPESYKSEVPLKVRPERRGDACLLLSYLELLYRFQIFTFSSPMTQKRTDAPLTESCHMNY